MNELLIQHDQYETLQKKKSIKKLSIEKSE